MRSNLWVLVLGLSACSRGSDVPLEPPQLEDYQACSVASDCVLAENKPYTCGCGGGPPQNPVAINKNQIVEFRESFDNEDECPAIDCVQAVGPWVNQEWTDNKYEVGCAQDLCTLTIHEDAWDFCNATMSCAAGHDCRQLPQDPFNTYCWWVGTSTT